MDDLRIESRQSLTHWVVAAVLGSLLLAVLAAVMIVTRNVDWSAIGGVRAD